MKNIVKTIAAVMLLGVLAASCQKENNKDLPALPDMTERTVNYAVDGTMTSTTVHGVPGWTEFLSGLMDQVDAGHRVSLLHGGGASQSKETVVRYTPSRDSAMAWVDSMYTLGYDVAVWYDSERQSYVGVASMSTAPAPSDRQWPDGALLGLSTNYYYLSGGIVYPQISDTMLTVYFYNPSLFYSTLGSEFSVIRTVIEPRREPGLGSCVIDDGAVISIGNMGKERAIELLKENENIYAIEPAAVDTIHYTDQFNNEFPTAWGHVVFLALENEEDTLNLMPLIEEYSLVWDGFHSQLGGLYLYQIRTEHSMVNALTALGIFHNSGLVVMASHDASK